MNTMANMNDRYMEEYEAARSGRPSIQETLTKAQEQERKKNGTAMKNRGRPPRPDWCLELVLLLLHPDAAVYGQTDSKSGPAA